MEGESLISFWIGEEIGKGEGQEQVKAGVREDPKEVRLVDCFDFFSVFGDGFTREEIAEVDLLGGCGCGGPG